MDKELREQLEKLGVALPEVRIGYKTRQECTLRGECEAGVQDKFRLTPVQADFFRKLYGPAEELEAALNRMGLMIPRGGVRVSYVMDDRFNYASGNKKR